MCSDDDLLVHDAINERNRQLRYASCEIIFFVGRNIFSFCSTVKVTVGCIIAYCCSAFVYSPSSRLMICF